MLSVQAGTVCSVRSDILLTVVLDTDTLNALSAGRYSLLSEV